MFNSEKVRQLKIYLLFMEADGESSKTELKHLDDIVSTMNLSDTERTEFQAFLGRLSLEHLSGDSASAISEINKLLDDKQGSFFLFNRDLDSDKTLQTQTVWTLINLGYADGEYSDAEKAVVENLINRWEMDPILTAELNDTADTILALTREKEWVQNTAKPYKEINSIVQEIDQDIAAMFANIEITIAEAKI